MKRETNAQRSTTRFIFVRYFRTISAPSLRCIAHTKAELVASLSYTYSQSIPMGTSQTPLFLSIVLNVVYKIQLYQPLNLRDSFLGV